MTYQHTAAVNTIGITSDSKLLVTGDNTGTSYIWDVHGGNLLKKMENEALLNLKSLSISNDDKKVVMIQSGRTKDSTSSVDIYNLLDIFMKNQGDLTVQAFEPLFHIESSKGQKYVTSKFNKNDALLYLSRDDGFMEIVELSKQKTILNQMQFHENIIMDFDVSSNEDMLITASIDGFSKVIDAKNFEVMKSFQPQNPTRNINACKFAPGLSNIYDELSRMKFHAVISGGQDCRNVTTTNAKEGGFDLDFINTLTGEISASIKGHFGPVNTLAFSGNGKILASGGEDSTVRLHNINDDLFEK
jgi:translation initiation factor 3 subunit I